MDLKKCSECGTELNPNDSVCSNCGNPIPNVNNTIFERKEEETNNQKQNILCSECGNELNPTDNMCSNCGNPINQKDNSDKNNMDTEINANIQSYLICGEIVKWANIFISIIILLVFLISFYDSPFWLIGIFIFVVGLINAFLSSMMIKWFGYTLKCLYDIKNEKINMKE